VLGARIPQVCAAAAWRRRDRTDGDPGDLRAGQHAGDPRGAEGRPRRGDRMNPMNSTSNGGILIEGLRKVYGSGDTAVEALKHVNMRVAPGEVVGLVGPSGSGK